MDLDEQPCFLCKWFTCSLCLAELGHIADLNAVRDCPHPKRSEMCQACWIIHESTATDESKE